VIDNIEIFQVVAGLVVPFYIVKLDFKTREELQSMPQTEEEHLENQYLDYEEKEKSISDAEVNSIISPFQ
jgi:transient receptor potential cation channel subfamily M member 3